MLCVLVCGAAASYLLIEYLTGQPGLCLTGSGCDLVRASAYAYPLGIPMPLFGLVLYAAAGWLTWRSLSEEPVAGVPVRVGLLVVASLGVAASAVLTGLEAFVIRAWCSWCLVSAVASVGLLAAAILLARSLTAVAPVDAAGRSSRARRMADRAVGDDRAALRRLTVRGGGGAVLAVSALLVVGALAGAPPSSTDPNALAPAWAPRLGSGPVTVVEFADFQCPGCAGVSPMLRALVDEGSVTLVYRHFPLPNHAHALPAARAAVAAGQQDAFWPMAEALYASQEAWKDLGAAGATEYWAALADQLGLDVAAWQAALGDATLDDPIQADQDDARTLALNGTPTLYLDGVRYTGELSLDALRAAVAEAAAAP